MNIFPVKGLKGELKVPGDKSISHRGLIISSLARGKSSITGFLAGEDCLSTLECLKQLGVRIITKSATEIDVYGVGLYGFKEPVLPLNAGNSGTTARILIGLLAGQNFFSVITGDDSLSQRPMDRIVRPLQKMGASIIGRQKGSMLPLAIDGSSLQGIDYELPVASAQLKSAIILAGLFAESPTTIKEPIKSRNHTELMLEYFGLKLEINNQTIKILPGQEFDSRNISIPGDFSSAAFFIVGSLITPNSDLLIKDVGINPTRTGLIHVLQKMGGNISLLNQRNSCGELVADIHVTYSELKGVVVEGDIIPTLIDEIPILAVAALYAEGETIIKDAKELRVKETDRISALVSEFRKIGGSVEELPDGLIVHGKTQLQGGKCQSYHDHRIAMALAIAGLNVKDQVNIIDPDCVTISYPNFFKDLASVASS